ncbi:MAG: DUF1674 domain-containing protein [Pseudomonadota bacterium]|nr:DUF1674 domain-containing protein [Pseudomonadota bacterium]
MSNYQEKILESAKKALEEAKHRNAKLEKENKPLELGGRAGPEPTRYGDWEKKGIISDF